MSQAQDTLGIIAGSGSLPLLLARQARALGVKRLVAVAFENETHPELAGLVDKIVWIKVGQLSRMIAAFNDNGAAQCVMAGQIAPKNLFQVRPDLRAMSLLFKLREKNAHTLVGAAHGPARPSPRSRTLRRTASRCRVRVPDRKGSFAPGDRADRRRQERHGARRGRI